jgi:putative mRNA 3-end processing factor
MDLEPEIYSTSITARLSGLLARDTLKISEKRGHNIPYYNEEIQDFERRARPVNYLEEFETSGFNVCFYDAGHIPGSSSVYLEKDKQSLFYTGDINTIQTELLNGADTKYPRSDILLIESTYFGRNHTPRAVLEERFIESVKETIDNGGKAIIPAFSIGRTQEIMLILKKHGLHAYVDGMGVDVFNIMKREPEYVRDIDRLKNVFTSSNIVEPEQRRDIIREPCIIVTSAGMLNGGPVLYYISEIYDDAKSKIHLTGYQAEDTNGREAVKSGYIEDRNRIIHLKCRLELYDFSAHGDNTQGFADWIKEEIGVRSTAPVNGETIYI